VSKLICPNCKSQDTVKNGANRALCKACDKRFQVKNALQLIKEVSSQAEPFIQSRYVITAAVNNTPVHAAFWATLQNYCKVNKARLIVVPLQYKNPTSRAEQENQESDVWYAPEVMPYLYRGRTSLCENLTLCADVSTQPTAARPLSGLTTFGGKSAHDSVIFAHPKRAMETVATQAGKQAKLAITTGACTEAWYSDSKAGAKGEFHHAFAALVVEVDKKLFHVRRLSAKSSTGFFQDLNKLYTPDTVTQQCTKVLTCGDLHAVRADPTAL